MIHRMFKSAGVLLLVVAAGCGCDSSRIVKFDAQTTAVERPSRIGATLSQELSGSGVPPPPVLRVVHHQRNGPKVLVYHAMVCPWPFSENPDNPGPLFGVQLAEVERTWAMGRFFQGAEKTGLLGAASPAVPVLGAGGTWFDDYDATQVTATGGTGWVYLTGDKPVVKTIRVIGGADGTTFFCQVTRTGRTEYHRFALVNPTATQKVDLSLCTSPGVIARTLDSTNTLAVYSYNTWTDTGDWTPPTSVFGTGPKWDGFEEALKYASEQALKADLH